MLTLQPLQGSKTRWKQSQLEREAIKCLLTLGLYLAAALLGTDSTAIGAHMEIDLAV